MSILKDKCSNMTRANKYISNIIKSLNIGEPINNKFIKELVYYHPTKNINSDEVELK